MADWLAAAAGVSSQTVRSACRNAGLGTPKRPGVSQLIVTYLVVVISEKENRYLPT